MECNKEKGWYEIMEKLDNFEKYTPEYIKYLELLSREYPTQEDTFTEIISGFLFSLG